MVKKLQQKIDNFTFKLDKDLMDNYIKPFCNKWGLDFTSENGNFYLLNHNEKYLKNNGYDIFNLSKKSKFYKEYNILYNQMLTVHDYTKFWYYGYFYKRNK